MPLRAAVVLRGAHTVHRESTGRTWGPQDWRRSLHSLNASYIHPRKLQGYQVDVFYHTHRSNESKHLRRMLHPSNASEAAARGQLESGLLALLGVRDPWQYSEFLWTRFDVLYKRNVQDWNLHRGRFNAPFRQPDGGLCDVFFVFGAAQYSAFVDVLRRDEARRGWSLHATKFPFAVHLMDASAFFSDTDAPETQPATNNTLYSLLRKRRWGSPDANLAKQRARFLEWHRQEFSNWWWAHRLVRFLRFSSAGAVCGVMSGFVLLANAGVLWRSRSTVSSRPSCVALAVRLTVANLVWLPLPAMLFQQNVVACAGDTWCWRHGPSGASTAFNAVGML